jgi:hypothetical protein
LEDVVRLAVYLLSGIARRRAGTAAQHVRTIAQRARISTAVSVFAVTVLAAGALISVPATAAAASGPGDFLTIISQPGDFVGQGQSYSYVQSTTTFRQAWGVGTDIAVDTWTVQLGAPKGGRVQVGTYTGATSSLVGNNPYISITGTGHGCNTSTGSFTVLAVTYDQSGFLLSLHATFQQACLGATAGLSGEVFFFAPPVVIPGQNVAYAGGSRSFDLGAFADGERCGRIALDRQRELGATEPLRPSRRRARATSARATTRTRPASPPRTTRLCGSRMPRAPRATRPST